MIRLAGPKIALLSLLVAPQFLRMSSDSVLAPAVFLPVTMWMTLSTHSTLQHLNEKEGSTVVMILKLNTKPAVIEKGDLSPSFPQQTWLMYIFVGLPLLLGTGAAPISHSIALPFRP